MGSVGFSQTAFAEAFERLNANQRAAVQQTDGPLLVIAGPGTGKTQLLGARVAYILQRTDTLPQNILCLTFTDSGAANMRERLTRFIGPAAYDVTIGTYHAFGGDLIARFPHYFGEHREQRAADRLAQRQIIQDIVDAMPFSNPLKSTQYHLHDLLATISEVKRGLLDEDDLRAIAQDNLTFLADTNQAIKEIFANFTIMPRKLDVALPYFQNLHNFLSERDQEVYRLGGQLGSPGGSVVRDADGSIVPLAEVVKFELEQALHDAATSNSTKPLTAWKNRWLVKGTDNSFVLAGQRDSERIAALADVFRQYTDTLNTQGLYDFDDMILRAISALERHQDLRYTLHEQYQYILLDEFQDTNAAQLKLIKLLTDNPVSEGRPNVMAVGDDDQAIYAFQGAEVSNMLDFVRMYRDVQVINLTENYRSHPEILHVAHEVAGQIGTRLTSHFSDMSKLLTAARHDVPPQAHIDRHEFQSDVGQYSWIADQITGLIEQGTNASEIAVLAPRHKQLEPLVAYLNKRGVPVRYEKRENILEAPVVQQLLTMSKLVLALKDGEEALADSLWPEVLSYNFWQYPTSDIWQLSWQVREKPDVQSINDSADPGMFVSGAPSTGGLTGQPVAVGWPLTGPQTPETNIPGSATSAIDASPTHAHLTWSQAVVSHPTFRPAGLLMLTLAQQAGHETLETMLDRLIGNEPVMTNEPVTTNEWVDTRAPHEPDNTPESASAATSTATSKTISQVTSPLRAFYLGEQARTDAPDLFYQTLSHLTVLRQQLRDHQQSTEKTLQLQDMLDLAALYEAAGERMLNTSPYNQHAEAVQLMTVFKAKGLEFEHVFLPSCQDDVWGESSRAQSNRLTLPPNLMPIRPAGTTQDERLRIFFVAVTRAKLGLHLTSFLQSYSGRATKRLRYLNEIDDGNGGFKTLILPAERQTVRRIDHQPPRLDDLELNWRHRHLEGLQDTSLRDLLSERLARYQLSPTHITAFTDLMYAGPESFFLHCLLNFPVTPSNDAQYGNAIHETLYWYQLQLNTRGQAPGITEVQQRFAEQLKYKHLHTDAYPLYLERGQLALNAYLHTRADSFRAGDKAEYNFHDQGVFIGNNSPLERPIHMAGRIDRLRIDHTNKTITIIDYKTGAAYNRWSSDYKLHAFRLQLYCYKLLVEHSRAFRGYQATQAILEFVEPGADGRIHTLALNFQPQEEERVTRLAETVWHRVCNLELPDTSTYDTTLNGRVRFEADLIQTDINKGH